MRTLSIVFLLFIFLLPLPAKAVEKIDINSASFEALQKIVWVGPKVAQQIIDSRPFYSLDNLRMKINFIGEKRLADIKKQGLAWVDSFFQKTETPVKSVEKEMAVVSQPLKLNTSGNQAKKPAEVLLIALLVAVFSGIIIFTLKRELMSSQRSDC